MNIFADFTARVRKAIETLDLKDKDGGVLDLSRVTVEPPRDATHGDLADSEHDFWAMLRNLLAALLGLS